MHLSVTATCLVANDIIKRNSNLKILLVEKDTNVASQQSGHNIDINEHDSYVGLVEAMPFLLSSLLIKLSHNSSSWKEVFRYFDDNFNSF